MQTTQLDPIITEVSAIRDKYTARLDYDVGRIFRDFKARQNASDPNMSCCPAWRPFIYLSNPR